MKDYRYNDYEQVCDNIDPLQRIWLENQWANGQYEDVVKKIWASRGASAEWDSERWQGQMFDNRRTAGHLEALGMQLAYEDTFPAILATRHSHPQMMDHCPNSEYTLTAYDARHAIRKRHSWGIHLTLSTSSHVNIKGVRPDGVEPIPEAEMFELAEALSSRMRDRGFLVHMWPKLMPGDGTSGNYNKYYLEREGKSDPAKWPEFWSVVMKVYHIQEKV